MTDGQIRDAVLELLAIGMRLFSVAAIETLVTTTTRGSAPVAVRRQFGGHLHGATAAGVGYDAHALFHPIELPANSRRGGGR